MLDWIVAVVGLLTALYWYLTWHYAYWRGQGVFTPPGVLPGIGHMWDVITFKKAAPWLHCEIYDQTKGRPAVGLYDFRQPALLVRDLSLVQAVLVSDFSSFHDNPAYMDETIDPHVAKNPFILKGQKWKTLRQKLSPALSPARIKTMFPMMEKVCQEFKMYMEKHLKEDIDIHHITGLFTSEVVAKCAFGVEGSAFKDENSEFYQQGRKLWDATIYNPIFQFILMSFPFINNILRKSVFPKELVGFFRDLIKQAADYREKNPEKVSDDYLQYLLSLSKKDSEFTLEDVLAQSLTFFTDGFETTSMAASFLLYELTVNPDIQQQLRNELTALDAFTYENISGLPLLDRILNETLRKYGAISMAKECTRNTNLQAEGFSCDVPKGMQVIIPVHGIHYDPDIYPDPDRFDPDRFLPENTKKRHPMAHLGFSAGPRMCIGHRLATTQVKLLVANIITHFRLVKSKRTPEKIIFLKTMVLPVSDVRLWIQFEIL